MNRIQMYMQANQLMADEIAGATELGCELDLRGITGEGAYEIKGYCPQKSVSRCSECSLSKYGLDCHNNPVAR